jgi:hypothetical protein
MIDESSAIQIIFDDDVDIEVMQELVKRREARSADDVQKLEALMREHWGLPTVDISCQLDRIQIGTAHVKPSNDDEDSFTEDEWRLILAMRKICISAIDVGSPQSTMQRNIEWIFVRGTEEPRTGVSFHLACQMLRARPWVVQALVQHIWYTRSILPPPMPFLADPLPEALQSEAILYGWGEGAMILATIWMRPGIYSNLLPSIVKMDGKKYENALASLIEHGLVGNRLGRLYCISRPVEFRRTGQQVSWSASFIGD